jgi:hypothetical protein
MTAVNDVFVIVRRSCGCKNIDLEDLKGPQLPRAFCPAASPIRIPHPPPKLCGVKVRSNTFHSSYLSGGSML